MPLDSDQPTPAQGNTDTGTDSERVLSRDVTATIIPSGDTATLPSGTHINITNRLGGNFTVVCDRGMFRIKGTDASALGEQPPATQTTTPPHADTGKDAPPEPNEDVVWEQLKTVFDPEIPVNIVDLGLVYSLRIHPAENEPGKFIVGIAMTLTAPGCGMGPVIAEDARNRILSIPGVHDAHVDIVWEPPWTTSMISEEGKMELGLM
ncbi:MAG: putative Fe-S cluster assembly protein SufT [Puniceicoccales bacterium]|jgi:probable FeS assembly SUF system protein SufT|nr:putative Fe-S cluster assembly protein SufT [Puniceicoccales bacterium]